MFSEFRKLICDRRECLEPTEQENRGIYILTLLRCPALRPAGTSHVERHQRHAALHHPKEDRMDDHAGRHMLDWSQKLCCIFLQADGSPRQLLWSVQIGVGTFLGMYLSEHIRAQQAE